MVPGEGFEPPTFGLQNRNSVEPPDNYKNTSAIRPELDPNNPLHRALLTFGRSAGFLEFSTGKSAP
jgi:hypothetical protein